MGSPEAAEKLAALEADLFAKSSRIAELEARVSVLEAENARLKRAMAKGGGAPDLTGEEDPVFGRLEESLVAHKETAAEKEGEAAVCGVLVLSDSEEEIAVDANKGRSPNAVVSATPTTRTRAVGVVTGEGDEGSSGRKGIVRGDSHSLLEDDDVLLTTGEKKKRASATRVVTSDSEDEDGGELEHAGEGNKGGDSNVSLEDDDVSVTPRTKKRAAARMVTSDSEGDDVNAGEPGSGEDADGDDKEAVVMPRTRRRKRALRRVSDIENEGSDEGVHVAGSKRASVAVGESEDEDDRIPISQVIKKNRKKRASGGDKSGDAAAQGCSTPTTRRSARLVKKRQAASQVLNFVEPKEREASEDEMEEDGDMDDFINDGDSSEDASGSAEASSDEQELSHASAGDEESSPEPEDSVMDYKEVMDCIGRKKKNKNWALEGDMLAAFRQNPELCLKAVCAIYRRQTRDEQLEKSAFFHNKQGFSHTHATRGSFIAEFLLDGDPYGPLKKTVDDLEAHDSSALGFCQMVASHYSKQLFAIYQDKEDPYFHP